MRFRKSFKIVPGVRINLSRSGVSTTLGGRGASVNIGRRGTRTTVGIPGTGLSFSQHAQWWSRGRSGGHGRRRIERGSRPGRRVLERGMSRVLPARADRHVQRHGAPLVTFVSHQHHVVDSSHSTSTPSSSASGYGTSAYSADPEAREWFYIHGTLNVRAEPEKDASVVRSCGMGITCNSARRTRTAGPGCTARVPRRATYTARASWCSGRRRQPEILHPSAGSAAATRAGPAAGADTTSARVVAATTTTALATSSTWTAQLPLSSHGANWNPELSRERLKSRQRRHTVRLRGQRKGPAPRWVPALSQSCGGGSGIREPQQSIIILLANLSECAQNRLMILLSSASVLGGARQDKPAIHRRQVQPGTGTGIQRSATSPGRRM